MIKIQAFFVTDRHRAGMFDVSLSGKAQEGLKATKGKRESREKEKGLMGADKAYSLQRE
jgi:hypothetical protein